MGPVSDAAKYAGDMERLKRGRIWTPRQENLFWALPQCGTGKGKDPRNLSEPSLAKAKTVKQLLAVDP